MKTMTEKQRALRARAIADGATLMREIHDRPGFDEGAAPAEAIPLYEYFIELMRDGVSHVETGRFGADMKILADNDGPVTIILENNND